MELLLLSPFNILEFSCFSSSGTRPIPPQHQVFINFRGADVRKGFLEILVDALKEEQVNVYVDEDELRGQDLTRLYDRIQESRVAVTIFSERYTNSEWCLNELVRINSCVDEGNLQVFPIFFNVAAEDVKKLEGNFGRNFRKLKKTHKGKEMKKNWKDALKSVSRKFGLSSDIRYFRDIPFKFVRHWYERCLAKLITDEVKRMLTEISRREEELRIRQRREREQLAEARRNLSLSRKAKDLIVSVIPKSRVMVFLMISLVAHYFLWFTCGVLYYTGSFASQLKSDGTSQWIQ